MFVWRKTAYFAVRDNDMQYESERIIEETPRNSKNTNINTKLNLTIRSLSRYYNTTNNL